MRTRKVSLIIFYDENFNILLQSRKEISKAGEEWGFFGGQIEESETPEQALIRETQEELDYKLDSEEFIFLQELEISMPKIDLNLTQYIFVSKLENKYEQFTQYEGDEMKLFSILEARNLKIVECDFQTLDIIENYFKSLI